MELNKIREMSDMELNAELLKMKKRSSLALLATWLPIPTRSSGFAVMNVIHGTTMCVKDLHRW